MKTPQHAPAIAGSRSDRFYRYLQLMLLVVAAGAIYPVLYLRQVYQSTMLDVLAISDEQLGYLYSILGTAFAIGYLPSGWLADRMPPRVLISLSLLGVGGLALWYGTLPAFPSLLAIFFGFGIFAGLTFWAALLKRVKTIAADNEQGRFFGILDGGRGLIEALLATTAIWLFSRAIDASAAPADAFRRVIHLYAVACLALGVVLALLRDPAGGDKPQPQGSRSDRGSLWTDVKMLLRIRELWLVTAIVFCGFHFFYATYSFSDYLEKGGMGLSATAAGVITTIKLWMRPVGGIGGGWLGDRFSRLRMLTLAMVLAALGMIGLITLPSLKIVPLMAVLVIFIGLMTYAIRGLYWAILDDCNVPLRITGLAIGVISVIGYLPDAFLPLLNGWITQHYPGVAGYQIYFSYITVVGLLGVAATLVLHRMIQRRKARQS
jgi:sugar phosphate permease